MSVASSQVGLPAPQRISDNSHDSPLELDTLNWMLTREVLVDHLAEISNACTTGQPWDRNAFLEALMSVREASLEVVERVNLWNRALVKKEVFRWNTAGDNYVIKMARDLDMLKQMPLPDLFGFTLANKSPFALPVMPPKSLPDQRTPMPDLDELGHGRACTPQTPTAAPTPRHERLRLLNRLATVDESLRARLKQATDIMEEEFARCGANTVVEQAASWGFDVWQQKPWTCPEFAQAERKRLRALRREQAKLNQEHAEADARRAQEEAQQNTRLRRRNSSTILSQSGQSTNAASTGATAGRTRSRKAAKDPGSDFIDAMVGDLRQPLLQRLGQGFVTQRMLGIPNTAALRRAASPTKTAHADKGDEVFDGRGPSDASLSNSRATTPASRPGSRQGSVRTPATPNRPPASPASAKPNTPAEASPSQPFPQMATRTRAKAPPGPKVGTRARGTTKEPVGAGPASRRAREKQQAQQAQQASQARQVAATRAAKVKKKNDSNTAAVLPAVGKPLSINAGVRVSDTVGGEAALQLHAPQSGVAQDVVMPMLHPISARSMESFDASLDILDSSAPSSPVSRGKPDRAPDFSMQKSLVSGISSTVDLGT